MQLDVLNFGELCIQSLARALRRLNSAKKVRGRDGADLIELGYFRYYDSPNKVQIHPRTRMNEELPLSWPVRASGALGFVSGFVDACGLIALFGISITYLPNHSFVIDFPRVQSNAAIGAKALCFPIFLMAIAATCFFVRRCGKKQFASLLIMSGMQIALIAMFSFAGFLALPSIDADNPKTIIIGFVAATMMGVQSALSQLIALSITRQTVMPRNITQAMIDLSDLMCGLPGKPRAAAIRFERNWISIAHFACGVGCGIIGYVAVSFWCLVVPMVMLLIIVVLISTQEVPKHLRRYSI